MGVQRVVVGVDLGGPSVEAARWTARHLARDAEIVLAHVVAVPERPGFLRGFYPPTDELVEDARRGAELRLRELAGSLGGGRIRSEVRVGRSDDELARLVEEVRADLLVVGPHRERPGVWRLLGSTAERVVRRAPTSVLLGRGLPPNGPGTILAAFDESELTGLVVRWAAELAARSGARVVALHVINRVPPHPAFTVRAPEGADAEEPLRRETERWMREQLRAGDLDAAAEVAIGDPSLQILSAVERTGADLLVIGRHGKGRGGGPFLGSVAEFLLRNGTGPVLAVASAPDGGA